MNILFVNKHCGYLGGVEQNIAETVKGLKNRGHKCFLVYEALTNRDAQAYMALFDACFSCPELGSKNPPPEKSFAHIFQKLNPDVVYLHKVDQVNFCEPIRSKTRIVRMVHDHDLCCPRQHKYLRGSGRVCHHKAGWRCWLDLAFLGRDRESPLGFKPISLSKKKKEMQQNYVFDSLLVGSQFMKQELLQNGFSQKKVHILPPVVQKPKSERTQVPSQNRILYTGQLIRGKGVDLLLQALAKISVNFQVIIAGTGNAEAKLKKMCHQLKLDNRVQFKGWVPHEQLNALYAWAKVVVVPSRWPEPFGMVGLEAMHHGRPVVGFDVGGIPDWIEHGLTGQLVPEQDVQAFANATERLLRSTALARWLGRNAYRQVHKRYSFDGYLDGLENHLRGTTLESHKTAIKIGGSKI